MHVLLVANGYPPTAFGGVEVYVASLAAALLQRGYRVTVICAEGQPSMPDRHLVEDRVEGVTVYRVVNNFKRIGAFEQTFADSQIDAVFDDLLVRLSPDLVHFNHLIALSARLPLMAAARHIPSVVTLHDFWPLCQRVNLRDWKERRCPGPEQGGDCYRCVTAGTLPQRARTAALSALRTVIPYPVRARMRSLFSSDSQFVPDIRATPQALARRQALFREAILSARAILAPSQFVRGMFVSNGFPPETIQVVPLGIQAPAGSPPPAQRDATIHFGFIGSMLPLKGVEVLIRAFSRVRGDHVRLSLYGRGDIIPSYTRYLKRMARWDRRITFHGPFQPEEKESVYRQIDVLVIPSVAYETFSLVAREALLRGKPVVASSIGALPETIVHGVNGFLAEPGDAAALADLLSQIAAEPDRLSRLQIPGPVAIPTVDEHLEQLGRVYASAVA